MDSIGQNIGKLVLMVLIAVGAIAAVAVYVGEYGYKLGYFMAGGSGTSQAVAEPRPIPADVLLGCLIAFEPYEQCAQDIPPPQDVAPAQEERPSQDVPPSQDNAPREDAPPAEETPQPPPP